jgi:hypothetical protein
VSDALPQRRQSAASGRQRGYPLIRSLERRIAFKLGLVLPSFAVGFDEFRALRALVPNTLDRERKSVMEVQVKDLLLTVLRVVDNG